MVFHTSSGNVQGLHYGQEEELERKFEQLQLLFQTIIHDLRRQRGVKGSSPEKMTVTRALLGTKPYTSHLQNYMHFLVVLK